MAGKKLKKVFSTWYYTHNWRFRIELARLTINNWWKPYREPQKKFIVFAQGRTGSTTLVDLINQSTDLHCDGEIFGAGMPLKVGDPWRYLRARIKERKAPVYGFRLKVYDLQQTQSISAEENRHFIRTLFDQGWKIIYLRRDLKFRQAMSSLLAEARGYYHTFEKKEAAEKVSVDAQSLPYRIDLLHKFTSEEKLCLEGHEFLEINYEQDLMDESRHQKVLDRVCDFLGTPRATAQTRYHKTSPENLAEVVENYEEVECVMRQNNLSHYL